LTVHAARCILDRMRRIALYVIACACVAAVAALAQPSSASAGWCWPCSGYGLLGPSTSTHTLCWFSSGEVCGYYNGWFNVGMAKTCYPGCDWNYNTTGVVLYGFENHERIRGRFSSKGGVTLYVQPYELGMSGLLRPQVTWYGGPASQINAAAIG
jgi:hypothetical protein